MATAISAREPSGELQNFSRDLFNFIWKTYSPNSELLAKALECKLKLEPPDDSRITKHFDEDIGKAVLVTQYLLREYCDFYLRFCSADSFSSKQIGVTIEDIISHWIRYRNNVFLKVFDAVAIVAEVYLYCYVLLGRNPDLACAPKIFLTFLNRKIIRSVFFKSGGWKQLRELALNGFGNLRRDLDQCESFRESLYLKYCKLTYDCKLIHVILNSDIRFPVEEKKICKDCKVSNLMPAKFPYRNNDYENKSSEEEESNDFASQQKDSLKFDPPEEESSNCDLPEEDFSPNLSCIPKKPKQDKKQIIEYFICKLSKTSSLDCIELPENKIEVKAKNPPKRN